MSIFTMPPLPPQPQKGWHHKVTVSTYEPDGRKILEKELVAVEGQWVKHTVYVKQDGDRLLVDFDPPVQSSPPMLRGDVSEAPKAEPTKNKSGCKWHPDEEYCPRHNLQCGYPRCTK